MKLDEMTELYISYRRALGEKFKTNTQALRSFMKYIGGDTNPMELTIEQVKPYLYYPAGKVTAGWFIRHTALKGMFHWAVSRGIMTGVPLPIDLPRRLEHMTPYIYSKAELKRLFCSAMEYQKNRSAIYPECMKMILQLTYFLGLRLHETMSIKIRDLNQSELYVYIRESKFYKSRIVTYNHKVRELINTFLKWREEQNMRTELESGLFLDKKGVEMHIDTVRGAFERIRKHADISRSNQSLFQPRIHDLRHTFAVDRLTAWYKENQDVQKLLPVLSTYLGHTHLSHTSVYLTMTDGLLREASKRFESYIKQKNDE
ncbi:tyrosine-type recombinase/integrase [Bacteroides fragilis]|jgi:site-specific recombinase XerD|uniref:Tyrosine-type recombinase/integrase n=2 Tax=Bacteroides fragilis TaxID=817 RepID=A0AAP9N8X4_BACFG|nr:tyrosine-type recombinase/integrase [Bacteroides fragilis]MBM6512024.1 tyrosine-type recombinase/integrase [Bacteroides fragilis]QKH82993.1 tyrosine-type recombinase/integrase [Bacteroides fragilis]